MAASCEAGGDERFAGGESAAIACDDEVAAHSSATEFTSSHISFPSMCAAHVRDSHQKYINICIREQANDGVVDSKICPPSNGGETFKSQHLR